ncbi:MAG: helix-turn-helix domain-containing protein, partial [Chloroflexi bacterium]|nr:helix-turn-helix domain-containing protein [Chloroflexota bacterium]
LCHDKSRTGIRRKKKDNEYVSTEARLIIAQAEFTPNASRFEETVEPSVEETHLEAVTPPSTFTTFEIESPLQEMPGGMAGRARAWLDSAAAQFKITVNRSRARKEAELESSIEPESDAQTFYPPSAADVPPPVEADVQAPSSAEIFAEIGGQLRKRRDMLSLTHDEIERHTHIRAEFLKDLEDGMLENLPSPVQTRGVLANYAGFLDLDVDAILLRFADGLQARHRERQGQKPVRTRAPMMVNTSLPFWRVLLTTDLLFGGGMAIMLVIFAIWGISFVVSIQSNEQPRATAPSIADGR